MSRGWTAILLFLLTQRLGYSLFLAAAATCIWWYTAEYYWIQLFSWWPEWAEFALTTLILFCLIGIGFWTTRKKIHDGLPPGLLSEPVLADSDYKNYALQRSMFLHVLPECRGLTQVYVLWLPATLRPVRILIQASWVFLLWIFLATPLHSGMMEWIASYVRKPPPFLCCLRPEEFRAADTIFNVRLTVPDVQSGRPSLPLRLDPAVGDKAWRLPTAIRSDLAVREQGTLLINAGDFPHLHRRAALYCAPPNCAFPGLPAEIKQERSLRAGVTTFDFIRSPRGGLNAALVLLTRWGRIIHRTVIEPAGDN